MSDLELKMPDELLRAAAWDTLAMVYDPELGINLVELGLVRKLAVMNGEISIAMTLTTPGCPMSDSMPEAVARALHAIPGIRRVSVDLVWEPRWMPEMMSERAKRELGWM